MSLGFQNLGSSNWLMSWKLSSLWFIVWYNSRNENLRFKTYEGSEKFSIMQKDIKL